MSAPEWQPISGCPAPAKPSIHQFSHTSARSMRLGLKLGVHGGGMVEIGNPLVPKGMNTPICIVLPWPARLPLFVRRNILAIFGTELRAGIRRVSLFGAHADRLGNSGSQQADILEWHKEPQPCLAPARLQAHIAVVNPVRFGRPPSS